MVARRERGGEGMDRIDREDQFQASSYKVIR